MTIFGGIGKHSPHIILISVYFPLPSKNVFSEKSSPARRSRQDPTAKDRSGPSGGLPFMIVSIVVKTPDLRCALAENWLTRSGHISFSPQWAYQLNHREKIGSILRREPPLSNFLLFISYISIRTRRTISYPLSLSRDVYKRSEGYSCAAYLDTIL